MIHILPGDTRERLKDVLPGSVHCCVTSPPFWRLRSYLKPGDPLKAQEIGQEATLQEHLDVLVQVFREVKRVLRDDGTLWIEYGDAFASGKGTCYNPGGGSHSLGQRRKSYGVHPLNRGNKSDLTAQGLKPGDLMGLPWRLALALQADGWYLRRDNILFKQSPMPESVNGVRWERCRVQVGPSRRSVGTKKAVASGPDHAHGTHGATRTENGSSAFDSRAEWEDCPGCPKCEAHGGWILRRGMWRCTTAHSYVFQFSKTDDYFCDAEAAKEPVTGNSHPRGAGDTPKELLGLEVGTLHSARGSLGELVPKRNPRSVWIQTPEPCSLEHFAVFPVSLPKRIITYATSEHGVCPRCGAPWARMVERPDAHPRTPANWDIGPGSRGNECRDEFRGKNVGTERQAGQRRVLKSVYAVRQRLEATLGRPLTQAEHDSPYRGPQTIGWLPTCDCPPGTPRPAVVLDPFGGTGTTAEAAEVLGRDSIICELNPASVALARKRTAQGGLFSSRTSGPQ